MLSCRIGIVFDFDGVLVDSYSCLPKVYSELARFIGVDDRELFVKAMVMLEDVLDYFGLWDRRRWWMLLFNVDERLAQEISRLYWNLRIKYTRVFDEVPGILEILVDKGYYLFMVTGCDDTVEDKKKRVGASGLAGFFKDILVYGCNSGYKDLVEAVNAVKKSFNGVLYYVDDKVGNLRRLVDVGVMLVHYRFKPQVFPQGLSWTGSVPEGVAEINSHSELLELTRIY